MKAKSLGFFGEELAARYLQSKGYEILENNFSGGGGEIDIVARKNGILIFVEVKTRTKAYFGEGNESINWIKRRRMTRVINRYIGAEDRDYRVDIIEIELIPHSQNLKTITHFEDIEL